jgi:hypothetical protein
MSNDNGFTGLLERNQRSGKTISNNDYLGLFLLAMTVTGILNTVGLLWIGTMLNGIAHRAASPIVQLADGSTINIQEMEGRTRTPASIKAFTTRTLVGLFSWNSYLPPESTEDIVNPKPDPGVKSGQTIIPTGVRNAAFALAEDQNFRVEFLKSISKLIADRNIFTRGTQVMFTPTEVTNPVSLGDGKWKLIVIGHTSIFDGTTKTLGESTPFAKEIYVKAVYVPFATNRGKDDLSNAIAKARPGLEIYGMKDYVPGNFTK